MFAHKRTITRRIATHIGVAFSFGLIGLLGLFLSLSFFSAQAQGTTPITINGTLLDSVTNAPIKNASGTVSFYSSETSFATSGYFTTGTDGKYSLNNISGLTVGNVYRLKFTNLYSTDSSFPGYGDQWGNNATATSKLDSYAAATEVTLQATNDVQSNLLPNPTINGTLLDSVTNAPIKNASGTVSFYSSETSFATSGYFTTGTDGKYSLNNISGLTVGTAYRLKFTNLYSTDPSFPGYGDQWGNATATSKFDSFDTATPVTLQATNDVQSKLLPNPTLIGTLIDSKTNEPIKNTSMSVSFYNTSGSSVCNNSFTTDATGTYTVKNCPSISPLSTSSLIPTGVFRLNFTSGPFSTNYPEQWHGEDATTGKKTTFAEADPVTVVAGPNNLKTNLEPYVIVRGTLLDSVTNKPLAKTTATISFYEDGIGGASSPVDSSSITTDAQGVYTATAKKIEKGTYRLQFMSYYNPFGGATPGYPNQWSSATSDLKDTFEKADSYSLDVGLNPIETKLQPFAFFKGKLIDSISKEPLKDRSGTIYFCSSQSDCSNRNFKTDDTGTYTATNVAAGTHRLHFMNPNMIGGYPSPNVTVDYSSSPGPDQWHSATLDPAGKKQTFETANPVLLKPGENGLIETALEPFTTLNGTLVDSISGSPLANFSGYVNFYRDSQDNTTEDQEQFTRLSTSYFTTDKDGKFKAFVTSATSPDNSYRLKFTSVYSQTSYPDYKNIAFPDQWHSADSQAFTLKKDYTKATAITLRPGPNAVTTRLEAYATLKGKLVDSVSGSPLVSAYTSITPFLKQADGTYSQSTISYAWTDDKGSYTIKNQLVAGTYKLKINGFVANKKPYPSQFHDGGQQNLGLGDSFTLKPGDGSENSLTTKVKPGVQVVVKFLDSQTKAPLANQSITALPYDATTRVSFSSVYQRTDSTGTYTVTLFPGKYELKFLPYLCESYNSSGYCTKSVDTAPVWYDNVVNQASAASLTLAEADVGTVKKLNDQLVRKLGGLTGQITGEDDAAKGLANISVQLVDPSFGYTTKSTQTDSKGQYQFSGVPEGKYKLSFQVPQGSVYLPGYHNKVDNKDLAEVLKITANATATVNSALRRGKQIVVKVQDEQGASLTNKGDVKLFGLGWDPSLPIPPSGSYSYYTIVPSGSDPRTGTYTFTALLPSKYKLHVSLPGYQAQWYEGIAPSSETDAYGAAKATLIDLATGDKSLTVKLPKVPGTNKISGLLKRADTNEPLAEGTVSLLDAFSKLALRHQTSLDKGRYEFQEVPPGIYRLQFEAPGFVTEYYNDKLLVTEATDIVISKDTSGATADATLSVAGRLVVHLMDNPANATPSPLANVNVEVKNEAGLSYYGTTDNNGDVMFEQLPPGNWLVNTKAKDTFLAYKYPTAQEVIAGQRSSLILTLNQGGKFTGQVTDGLTQDGLYGVTVKLYRNDLNIPLEYTASTDAKGYYTLPGIPPGSYKLAFTRYSNQDSEIFDGGGRTWAEGTSQTVAAGESKVVNQVLNFGETGRLTGRVKLSTTGVGVETVEVRVYRGKELVTSTSTSSEGSYNFSSLAPYTYTVQFLPPSDVGYATQWYNNQASSAGGTPIVVKKNATVILDDAILTPAPGQLVGKITGQESISPSVKLQTPVPLNYANVEVYEAATGAFVKGSSTDSKGSFSIAGLPAGSYKVTANSSGGYSPQWYNRSRNCGAANEVKIAATGSTSMTFTLEKAGIEGQIRGVGQKGLPNAYVYFHQIAKSSDCWPVEGSYFGNGYSKTDSTGHYSFTGLLSERYLVYASAPGYIWAYFPNSSFQSNPVEVPFAGLAKADLDLISAGSISGTVVAEDGTLLQGVELSLSVNSSVRTTAADGTFGFNGLYPGSYRLRLLHPLSGAAAKYPDQWFDGKLDETSATPIQLKEGEKLKIQVTMKMTLTSDLDAKNYNFMLAPKEAKGLSLPGNPITYELELYNLGVVTDSYKVQLSGNKWPTVVSPITITTLKAGGTARLQVKVTAPVSATGESSDTITLTVISQGGAKLQKETKLTTTIDPSVKSYNFLLTPKEAKGLSLPGNSTTYELELYNLGVVTDSYKVQLSGNKWPTVVSPTTITTLKAGGTARLQVKVTAPVSATGESADTTTLTVASQEGAKLQKEAKLTTTIDPSVKSYNFLLTPKESKGLSLPGTTATYELELRNTGYLTDSYKVKFSGNKWVTVISPTTNLSLPPGGIGRLQVKITAPISATGGNADSTTLTVTSQGSKQSTNEAKVTTSIASEKDVVKSGGTFLSKDGWLTIQLPSLAGVDQIAVSYTSLVTPTRTFNKGNVLVVFFLKLTDAKTNAALNFSQPFGITVKYPKGKAQESLAATLTSPTVAATDASLGLYTLNKTDWSNAGITQTSVDATNNQVSFNVMSDGEFVLANELTTGTKVYLPLILK